MRADLAGSRLSLGRIDPGEGKSLPAGEVEQPARPGRVARADDLEPDPLSPLQQLAALDECAQQQVRERAVLEQQLPQCFAIHRDIPHRLGYHGRDEYGLPREEVYLSEETRGAVADDLPPRPVKYGRLPLEDRDVRIGLVAYLI